MKRRIRNVKSIEEPAVTTCNNNMNTKRNVTFNDTITVKNEENLVTKKPLKLELVIENWKSKSIKNLTETVQQNSGVVQRLVDEYNTIEEVSVYNYDIIYR